MAFIPYSCQNISEQDIEAVNAVLRSEYLTQGPVVPAFEEAFAHAHQVQHAVAVSNATAALHLACLALDVGPGDLVWTSPNSFLASANCALYCGASIDFVDIDAKTRNMSLDALRGKLESAKRANRLPQLLIPVDFSGLPCDLQEMRILADQYGFKILEDASHATGASYLGRPVGGGYADATVFSFHAVKIVTTGEGGMVTTQDAGIAAKLRLLRSHGMVREPLEMDQPTDDAWYYEQQVLGFNFRLTDIQAALGLSQLKRLQAMHAQRIAHAQKYSELLGDLPVQLPATMADRVSAWHLYAIEIDPKRCETDRAKVFRQLRSAHIGVNVHYIPIHMQPYYARLGFQRGDFPSAERYYAQALRLPLFPAMTDTQQHHVVQTLRLALAST